MSSYSVFDITIWEQIRSVVELRTGTLLQEIKREITGDRSLRDYQGMYPVPWQMKQVMLQRANTWIQRLYELSCDAYKRSGKELSPEFDRAVWAYCIEPFIMQEVQTTADGYSASKLLESLLCAVGSPPEVRRQLKVGQKNCCLEVRNEMLFSWQQKLLRLARRFDEETDLASFAARQVSTSHTPIAPPSEPARSQPSIAPAPNPVAARTPAVSLPAVVSQPLVPPPSTTSLDLEGEVSEADRSLAKPRYSGATKWQDVDIVFLSDFRVQIRINGKQTQPANYAELGFADGRTENPNKAWSILRALAEQRGVLKDERAVGEPWPKVEKRIQEIRKVLRELFGISADPLPFVEGAGYQAIFKIRCGPSFQA